MTLIVRRTRIRECDLCNAGSTGPKTTVYEFFDDNCDNHRILFLCRRHASMARTGLNGPILNDMEEN